MGKPLMTDVRIDGKTVKVMDTQHFTGNDSEIVTMNTEVIGNVINYVCQFYQRN